MQCRTHIMSIELNSEYSQLWTNMDIYNSRQSAHSRHIRHSVPVAVCVRQRQSILTVGWLQLNVPAQESEWARATQFRLWDIVGRRGECTGNKCTSDFFRFFFVSFTFDTQHARIFPLQLLRFFRCCRCRIIILDSFSFSFVFFVFFFSFCHFPQIVLFGANCVRRENGNDFNSDWRCRFAGASRCWCNIYMRTRGVLFIRQ